MFRVLLLALTLLPLGPGIAFAVRAFGCAGEDPAIGAACGVSSIASFATLTAASWVVSGVGMAAVMLVGRTRMTAPAGTSLRLWSLLALLSFGLLVGAAGLTLTGSQLGFLAVPASLAVGWLFLANPQACVVSGGQDSPDSSGCGADSPIARAERQP